MNPYIILLSALAYSVVAQKTFPETTPTPILIPPNRKQPTINPDVDLVMGVLSPETTPVFSPRPIPPNRKRPAVDPNRDVVIGALQPGAALISRPIVIAPSRPVNIRSNKPVISKADIVMAVMDSMGTIVDNLAENLSGDWNNLLDKLPSTPQYSSNAYTDSEASDKAKRAMEGQKAVKDQAGIDSDAVVSFLKDLYGQLDSSDPKTVAEQFQERYNNLSSILNSNDNHTETLEEVLKNTLESQAEELEISLYHVSRLQYLLHLLAYT